MTWPPRWRGVAAGALILAGASCRPATDAGPYLHGKLDIVLVTIDTLRADAPGFGGDRLIRTPALDLLASESVVFDNAHAQNVVTLPSHANILTGLYPFQHGVRDNEGFSLPPSTKTLASYLRAEGYQTAAFIGAFPLDARFGLGRDFDVYDQHYPEGAHAYDFVMPERPASEVIAAARRWLDRAESDPRPRFLWVHLYDCHAPYRPPPPFDREYADHPYLGEVAGVDAALAPFLDHVRLRKGSTLLVLTGDHGEALGDHGEQSHGLFAYEATLHIPLLVWSPTLLKPRRDDRLARHVDIVPTILRAIGAPVPKELPGRSLLGGEKPPAGEISYFESLSAYYNRGWAPLRGAIGDNTKYIDLPIPELYSLKRDPGEKTNLVGSDLSAVRVLKKTLPEGLGVESRVASSGEAVRKLRSLGYLGGGSSARARYGVEDDPKNLIGLDRQMHDLVDLYQRGRMADAVAMAKNVVAARPSMQAGYDFLGFLLGQAGDDAAAIAVYESADRHGAMDEALRTRWGLLCSEAGRNATALSILRPLSESRDPDTLNALGIAEATAGNLPAALAAFRRALERDPRNAQAYQNTGIALLARDRVSEALESLNQALAVNDGLPRAWNARGVALERLHQAPEALEAWQHAVDLDSSQFDALFNIGLVGAETGRQDQARRALARFIGTAPAGRYGRELAQAKALLEKLGPGTPAP